MEQTSQTTFEAFRARPIPDQSAARQAHRSFRTIRIVPPPDDCDPALILAQSCGLVGRNIYAHSANPPYWAAIEGAVDALWLRPEVGRRLARVNAALAPLGLRLHLMDAWRPRAVQAYFHDHWMPVQLRKRAPDLQGEALWEAVGQYWSAPTVNAQSPAPHETGAAVDLTLAHADGTHLFMGSVFDDATAISHRDAFEGPEPAEWSFSFDEARANRRLLHWVMAAEGFAGHPNEWWHFSYGDQLWAALTGAPHALYGLAAPPLD